MCYFALREQLLLSRFFGPQLRFSWQCRWRRVWGTESKYLHSWFGLVFMLVNTDGHTELWWGYKWLRQALGSHTLQDLRFHLLGRVLDMFCRCIPQLSVSVCHSWSDCKILSCAFLSFFFVFLLFSFFFSLVRFIKFKMSWKSCSACTEGMAQSLEILVCCAAPELWPNGLEPWWRPSSLHGYHFPGPYSLGGHKKSWRLDVKWGCLLVENWT